MHTTLSIDLATDNQQQVMNSISVENFIATRKEALAKIQEAMVLLKEAGELTSKIGAGDTSAWASSHLYRWDGPFAMKSSDRVEANFALIQKNIDKDAWDFLMKMSGMRDLMDKEAKDLWRDNLNNGDFAELTVDNIYATFKSLHDGRGEVFERGVINIFKSLSYCYKTNKYQKFGRKIIKDYVVRYDSFGFSPYYQGRFEQLNDLERILKILDGQPIPDHTTCLESKFGGHLRTGDRHDQTPFEDDLFQIKFFKKGTAHVILKRQDLVEKLNLILARHYPDSLPAKV